MTDYGFLIDWDNNGYHAWDARPGDAVNLFGRAAANWIGDYGVVVHSATADYRFSTGDYTRQGDAVLVDDGDIKNEGLYALRWRTGTDSPYPNPTDSLFLWSDQYTDALLGAIKTYSLLLPSGTHHLKLNLKCAASTVTGMTLYARAVGGSSLGNTAIGTISAGSYTTVTLSFSVPSEQYVYFQITKSGVVNFTLYVKEPFLISGGGTHPAFNCGTASLSENLTADVMDARWNVGFKEPWRYVGDENRLRLNLRNADDTYSLENPDSPLYRSYRLGPMQIYIVANANSEGWQRLYTGYIETIRPQMLMNGRQTAELTAGTVRRLLDKQELEIALYEDIDSPDLLAALLDFENLVNVAPYLQAPTLVRMGEAFSNTDTQYELAGDQWPNGTRVLDAVGDVLQADFGKMWINRDGDAEYYLKLDYDTIFGLTFPELDDAVITGGDYEIIPAKANFVKAYSYPRKVSAAANKILWTLDSPIDLEAGETVEISVRYTVEDDELTIGGKDTTVDTFTVSGANVTYNWTEDDARGGTLEIISTAVNPRTVTAIIIKGRQITWFNAVAQKFRDNDAIAKWGKVTEVIENRLVEKRAVAKRLAQRAVAEFGEPRAVVKQVRLMPKTEAVRATHLGYKAGEFVRITEGQTHHSSRHMVIGEEHEIREGLKHHVIKLYLEQLPRWLVLDDDEAGLLDAGYYLA